MGRVEEEECVLKNDLIIKILGLLGCQPLVVVVVAVVVLCCI